MLLAESSDEAGVGRLVAVLSEDSKVGLLAVKGLGALTETTDNAVVGDGLLQDDLDGLSDVSNLTGSGGSNISRNGQEDLLTVKISNNEPFRHVRMEFLAERKVSKVGSTRPRVKIASPHAEQERK